MTSYIYDSVQELRNRYAEFGMRLRALEQGVVVDENGIAYTDPEVQKRWFREQRQEIARELDERRGRRVYPSLGPFRRIT